MIRQTSVIAYNEIKDSGLLGKRQKHAYDVLYKKGPLTGNELSTYMNMPGQWKRCSELKKRGLAIEVGKRKCSITGKLALLWDVTNNLPTKYNPKKTKDSIIKELQETIRILEARLELLGEK